MVEITEESRKKQIAPPRKTAKKGPWRPADWPRRVSVIGSKIAIQQVLDRRLIDWLDEVVVEARCT